jgi:hypothetical protein
MLGPTLSNTVFLFYEGKARHRELLGQAQQIRMARLLAGHHPQLVCRLLISLGRRLMETGMKYQERANRRLILQAHHH